MLSSKNLSPKFLGRCCKLPLLALAICAAILPATQASAVLIGNDVSVGRVNGSDGATQVFQVYFNAPVPGDGKIDSFSIFDQTSGNQGFAYVLRPQGGNNYLVLSEDIFVSTGTNTTKTFPVTPIDVQAGDLIAHYRLGVPYTDGALGGSFQMIYYPSAQPILSSTITLPSANYPTSPYIRDYAFAANFVPTPAPEPTSLCLLGLGAIVLTRASRKRRAVVQS